MTLTYTGRHLSHTLTLARALSEYRAELRAAETKAVGLYMCRGRGAALADVRDAKGRVMRTWQRLLRLSIKPNGKARP
jgi:hypothetical protein